jgi:hypothetical protein
MLCQHNVPSDTYKNNINEFFKKDNKFIKKVQEDIPKLSPLFEKEFY